MKYSSDKYNKTKKYKLSASIEADNFSIMLIDNDNYVDYYLHEANYSHAEEQIDWLAEHDMLTKDLSIDYFSALFIPSADYKSNKNQAYLDKAEFNPEQQMDFDFTLGDLTGVYGLTPDWVNERLSPFSDYNLNHVLERIVPQYLANKDTGIYVHWIDKAFYLTVIKEGKMLLANQYKYETATDAVYYILSAYKLIGADPHELPLHMSGQMQKESKVYNQLQGFVQHFNWLIPKHLNFHEDFPFQQHLFFHF